MPGENYTISRRARNPWFSEEQLIKEETLQLDERKNPISNLKNHYLRDIKNE